MVSPGGIQEGVKSGRVADLSSIDVSGSELQPSSSGDYKPQVDLRRFQQLLEEEEKTQLSKKQNISLKGQTDGGPSSTQVAHTANREPPVRRQNGPGKSGVLSTAGVSGHHMEQVLESEYPRESAWCDDSVHSGRGQGGVAPDEGCVQLLSEQGASEISSFPLGSSVRSSEGARDVELSGGGDGKALQFPGKLPVVVEGRVDGRGRPAGSSASAMEGRGNTDNLNEEEGDDGTLASRNTSKIHADLSRLELVRRIFFYLRRIEFSNWSTIP